MTTHTETEDYQPKSRKKPCYKQLYCWVLVAIILGILLGWLAPAAGVAMEPVESTFVTAMKMLIGPIVFLTIVGGIASVADLKKVGMTGIKALTYFQVGTIIALITGLVAINLFRLGDGVNADPSKIHASDSAEKLISSGETKQWWEFLTHIVPNSVVGRFVEGDILQIIFLAVIFGVALLQLDEIVDIAREASDTIAERMRALNAVPDGRSDTVAASTTLPAISPAELSTPETVDLISTRIYATVATLRHVHDDVDAADPSTADLLHQIIDSLEKAAWMLKSENRKILAQAVRSVRSHRLAQAPPMPGRPPRSARWTRRRSPSRSRCHSSDVCCKCVIRYWRVAMGSSRMSYSPVAFHCSTAE